MLDGGFDDGEGHAAFVFGIAHAKVLAFGKGEYYTRARYRFPG
ncbi:hypothetical protein [Nocardia sp. NPDC057440]